ncbi:MAG TPA: phosphoribosylanthranilate isomerase [Pyrinomonadaceae bacterium]|jgi:phosphoribosylanthranilate isomerase|nr:phosphoribosylanthranilate isomerase [Pyrinomonadaceae bacterium]
MFKPVASGTGASAVRVKVCGITNLPDALAAIDSGADALGFNFFEGSSRFIAPQDARRIIDELPPEILNVGVFVNVEEPEEVARMAAQSGVAAVQLHGDETPAFCSKFEDLPVIKALRVGADFNPEEVGRYETDAILLDAFASGEWGGTGRSFDWSMARRVREIVPKLFLAGGLTPENVSDAVASVRPFAVDVCSGVERAPGMKDLARLRRFVEAVRGAEGKA